MRTIQTQVLINGDRILSVPLPKDMPEGTYRVVIVMNSQPDPDDTPDEIVIEGIRQELKEAISGQSTPLPQMWEGIDVDEPKSQRNFSYIPIKKRSRPTC